MGLVLFQLAVHRNWQPTPGNIPFHAPKPNDLGLVRALLLIFPPLLRLMNISICGWLETDISDSLMAPQRMVSNCCWLRAGSQVQPPRRDRALAVPQASIPRGA